MSQTVSTTAKRAGPAYTHNNGAGEAASLRERGDEIELPTLAPAHDAPRQDSTPRSLGSRDDEAPPRREDTTNVTTTSRDARDGWIVVGASTVIFFVTLGCVYSFGVMSAVLAGRGYASVSSLGWVSSVLVGGVSALAIPCTWIVAKIGSRNTALVAAVLAGASQLATSFTFSAPIWTLALAQLVFGLSYSLAFWATNTLAAQYFDKNKALAIGIVYSGSGIGGAVFSIALSRLEQKLGLEWAVRVLALITWVLMLPSAWLLREKVRPQVSLFAMGYFRRTNFNLLFVVTALSSFSLLVPPFFLPTFAAAAGYSPSIGAYLVAGYNLASAFGRLGFGALADWRGAVTALTVAMTLMGASILSVWTVAGSNIGVIVFFLIVNGACSGALLSLQPAVNASMFPLGEMGVTMSMLMSSRTAGVVLGSPLSGWLLDAYKKHGRLTTDSFRPALLLLGSTLIVSSAVLLAIRVRIGGYDLRKRV
ncbi:unnamed protein product [Parajaminaea phylloscopi]